MSVWAPPSVNQGNWEPGVDVGVVGGIEQYLAGGVNDRAVTGTLVNMATTYSLDTDGTTDCTADLATAIAAASGPTVLYFPTGTYLFSTGNLGSGYKDNITIRGAGTLLTTFVCSTPNPIISFESPGVPINFDEGWTIEPIGTKTKGTSTLTFADTTGWETEVGRHAVVAYENETDNTRIIAGAPPVWVSSGSIFARQVLVKITEVTPTTISIDPPLPADGTNLELRFGSYPTGQRTDGWGFEDFSVSFDPDDHPIAFAGIGTSEGCWFHNVHFLDLSVDASNGGCIKMGGAYKNEIRKCVFNFEAGASTDGAIETGINSSCLFIDNIFSGSVDIGIYDSGNSCNCAYLYNFTTGRLTQFHSSHPSLNLLEGNIAASHKSDGYHGSGSNSTLFRCWQFGPFPIELDRFHRQYVIAGCVLGTDGTYTPVITYGNPNIGNGFANGFAGPTGLSDQEGQTDYSQPGYAPNEYVIQASDIFVGDFWSDWGITAVLTTRTSDTEGVFTVSGGSFQVGVVDTASSVQFISVRWDGYFEQQNNMGNGGVISVVGNVVTIGWLSGSLPDQGSSVTLWLGAAGWQERDLDVQPSTTLAENYSSSAGGTGELQDSISPDTLPDSLAFSSKPDFFGILDWPAITPESPDFSYEIIPAGYRYTNGEDPVEDTSTLTCTTLNVTTLTLG